MPQNEHIELFQKRYGKRLDHEEKTRKKEARSVHKKAEYAQKVRGSRAGANRDARGLPFARGERGEREARGPFGFPAFRRKGTSRHAFSPRRH